LRVSVPVPVARDAVGLMSSNLGKGVLLSPKEKVLSSVCMKRTSKSYSTGE
jgi:hypothetical protein